MSRGRRALLIASAALAPLLVLAGLVTGAGWLLPIVAGGAALMAWSLADIRSAFFVTILLATFVDYNTGTLTLQLAIVCSWIAWTCVVLLWRSAWTGFVRAPAAFWPGVAVWLGVCAFGVVHGLVRGNRPQAMGLELAAALWPLLGLGMMQAFGRKQLSHATAGLVAIGLLHAGFGLTMFQVYHHRIGGIYFTTVTGVAVVVLWSLALLAPARRTRLLCLIGAVPMLAHLLFSFTRGYWLGCLAGVAVATLLAWGNLGRFEPGARAGRLVMIPVLLLVFAGTVGLSMLYYGGGELAEAIGGRFGSSFSTEVSGETLSNVVRLDEYDRAIGAALESPLLGKGLGFSFITRDLLTLQVRDQWFVHNYYLLLWLKLGVPGLLAFGFLLWRFVREAKRAADREPSWHARAWSIAAIAVTVQVCVILLTNFSLADVNTAAVFAYVWGVFWSIRADRGEDLSAPPPPSPAA